MARDAVETHRMELARMNQLLINRLMLPTVALLWLFSPVVSADIYTCMGKDGVTAYQDRPCAGTQQQKSRQATAAESPSPAPAKGYASCQDMKFKIFYREGGLDLMENEDMVNFGWSPADLRAELERCNLPTFPADYL